MINSIYSQTSNNQNSVKKPHRRRPRNLRNRREKQYRQGGSTPQCQANKQHNHLAAKRLDLEIPNLINILIIKQVCIHISTHILLLLHKQQLVLRPKKHCDQ